MEKDYEKELNNNALYQFLSRNDGCQIYWISKNTGEESSAKFHRNNSSVYFYYPNYYHRTDLSTPDSRKFNSKGLLHDILGITRVEKQFDDKWLPVWTTVDGFIETDFCHFAYINERYYTFKELELIINEIKDLKKIIASLKVY